MAKVAVVAGATSWNFLLYRYWYSPRPVQTSPRQDGCRGSGGSRVIVMARPVEPSRQMLVVVPASNDEESVGSHGDRGSCREGQLGGPGATGKQDPGRASGLMPSKHCPPGTKQVAAMFAERHVS